METSNILIPGYDAYILADEFSEFTTELNSFAIDCYENQGKTKRYYSEAFTRLKESFNGMLAGRKISDWAIQPVTNLFEEIKRTINSKKPIDVK